MAFMSSCLQMQGVTVGCLSRLWMVRWLGRILATGTQWCTSAPQASGSLAPQYASANKTTTGPDSCPSASVSVCSLFLFSINSGALCVSVWVRAVSAAWGDDKTSQKASRNKASEYKWSVRDNALFSENLKKIYKLVHSSSKAFIFGNFGLHQWQ